VHGWTLFTVKPQCTDGPYLWWSHNCTYESYLGWSHNCTYESYLGWSHNCTDEHVFANLMFQPEILERFLTHIHQAVVCLGIEPGFSTAGLSKYCQIFTDFVRLRLPFLMTYNEQQSCVIFFSDTWRSQGPDCKHVSLSYVTPCIVLQIYWHFWGTRCLNLRSRMSAMSLRNVGKFLPHQTVHNYMLPWSTKSQFCWSHICLYLSTAARIVCGRPDIGIYRGCHGLMSNSGLTDVAET